MSRQLIMREVILWIDPAERKPDCDTTVLVQVRDDEVYPGYITADDTGREVWRREFWPSPDFDLTELEVLAWAEWPSGFSFQATPSESQKNADKGGAGSE
ncbi:hypothetical protein [Cerasicoccus frondis]|uniref:hypothetical protein n=1 Tax=Cerasicoccus frondis TaxID=490090 RepID=UPI0028528E19|nr:hypothetical protein [Cerasicoccus frondis]